MIRNTMERVMQILPATIVFVALLSMVSAVDGESSELPVKVVTLTTVKTATVTLTMPPSTITETSTAVANDFNLRTVTKTQHACPSIYPTASMDETSDKIKACLMELSSMQAENPVKGVGVTKIETMPPPSGENVEKEELELVSSTLIVVPMVPSTEDFAGTNLKSDNFVGFIDSLTTLLSKIKGIYPYVDEADQKVLETLTAISDFKKVETQLHKLPGNQKDLVVDEMFLLTKSISDMVDETVGYKRVVPINFMGSVKKLYRYLLRLIRF